MAMVAITGNNEAYLAAYRGQPQEFVSAAKYGYLYQGQPYSCHNAPRGYPAFGIKPETFVAFLENHDQISNSAFGLRVRLLSSPARYRAITALLLLGPWTPLLFQGEEFGASSPFVFFSEVGDEELRQAVRQGRLQFLAQFPSAASKETKERIAVPHKRETFERCKIDWAERERNVELHLLHRDLIRLRKEDSCLRLPNRRLDGAVLDACSFVIRFFGDENDDRLILVNFGRRHNFTPAPEPLLAPPPGCQWELLWTTEWPRYGGFGAVEVDFDRQWLLPAESTFVLRPRRRTGPRPKPGPQHSAGT